MGYLDTPDGRTIFAPDQFGGAPVPFDSSLQGPPSTAPPVDAPPAPVPAPLPSSSAFNQQAPAQVDMPPPQMGGIQPDAAPIAAPQPLPAPEPTAAPQQLQPDVNVAPPAPPTPAQKQAAAKQAAYENSAAGRQAAADAAYAAAQEKGQRAIEMGLAAETQKNDDTLNAQKQNDEDIKRINAEEQAKRAAFTQTRDQKLAQIDSLQKDVDNFKIDPTDGLSGTQHLGLMIAGLMAGLGDAMMHRGQLTQPNPIVGMMKDAADKNIRLQMDKRQQLQNRVGAAEQSFNRYEAVSKDDLAQFEVQRGLAYKSLARQLDLAASKAANPIAKANAMKASAQLDADGAQHLQAGADRAAQHEFQQQQLAEQAAARKQAQANSDRDFNERVREYDNSLAEKQREAEEKGQAKKAAIIEGNRKLGVFDPRSGTALPSEQGQKTLAAADAIEVQARKDPNGASMQALQMLKDKGLTNDFSDELGKLKNPTPQDALGLATKMLRDHANTVEVAQAPDEDAAKKIRPKLAASQNFVDQATKVRDFLRNDPSIIDRKGWATLQADFGNAMKNWAEANDMKFTNREAQALSEHIMSYDPSSISDRLMGKGPGAAAIDELIQNIKGETDSTLKANGIKSEWIPKTPDKASTFGGQTSQEIGADAEPGSADITKFATTGSPYTGLLSTEQKKAIASQRAGVPLTPDQQAALDRLGPLPDETTSARQRASENQATNLINVDGVKIPTSLDTEDAQRVITLAQQYNDATDRKREMIRADILAPVTSSRGSLAAGTLSLIKDQSPDLYRDVLKSLPANQRKEIESRDAALAKIQPKLPPLQ